MTYRRVAAKIQIYIRKQRRGKRKGKEKKKKKKRGRERERGRKKGKITQASSPPSLLFLVHYKLDLARLGPHVVGTRMVQDRRSPLLRQIS